MPQSKPGQTLLRRSAELLNKFQNLGAKARRAACPIGSRGGYGRLSTDSKRTQPLPPSKPGRTPLRRSAELRNKFLNSGAKEAEPPHAPKASRGYGRLITDSKRTQPLPPLKPGRTNRPRSAELRNKIGDILSHPLIRRALYYLLCVCLVLEEYLIRLLIEE